MNIYLTHSTNCDFENEIYDVLKRTIAKKHNIYFPHDNINDGKKSKDIINNSDMVLAEISNTSIGQGIELGWADYLNIPILCIYKKGNKISKALPHICKDFIEYTDETDLEISFNNYIDNYNKQEDRLT